MRKRLYEIIFESNTPAGKLFDLLLILSIVLSVIVVMLDSVKLIHNNWGEFLFIAEWFFTVLFTLEYFARLYCAPNLKKYALGFFGIIDLFAILPAYLSLLFPITQHLTVIRVLRVMRIFRILKIVRYVGEENILLSAFSSSRRKIIIFLFSVVTLTVVFGSIMYMIEFEENSGFTSIPVSVYWAIVTMTTVGYGDISPITPLGQFLAAIIMIMGYSIIAVPGGIATANLIAARRDRLSFQCASCGLAAHDQGAKHCKQCGKKLTI